jgi:hypothetical protein
MKRIASILLGLAAPLAYGQKSSINPPQKTLEATICKILDNPSAYNNTFVKIRGHVKASSEYSLLVDDRCVTAAIWLAFADSSATPQLTATVNGTGSSGLDSKGRQVLPTPVHLIKDSNYEKLIHYLAISAKGEACADAPPSSLLPDCTSYSVTATFTGRIDGVSKRTREVHRKRSSRDQIDRMGFGHMGIFDAQIVVHSVENVVAVDESEIRKPESKPQ